MPGLQASVDGQSDSETGAMSVQLQACLDVRGLSDSNVYSVGEMILLRWLNYHMWKANISKPL